MSHPEQRAFCEKVKLRFPKYFSNVKVLDVGSLDINGSNRHLFEKSEYLGIDIGAGPNVDLISRGHEYSAPDNFYDVICSTECFEHDMFYSDTLKNIVRMLKPKGLFFFTCATTGRTEHGTARSSPASSPFTCKDDKWKNYYKNLEEADIRTAISIHDIFTKVEFETNNISHDLYFWGIKSTLKKDI